MSMFEKAEQEYQDLVQRKTIIENDKSKIESVIDELEQKKQETLQKTWAKVNRDFGSIFSTLLPGANAKLEPEEGRSVRYTARHVVISSGLTGCLHAGTGWSLCVCGLG
jgi:structural maintenance of chromosome 2